MREVEGIDGWCHLCVVVGGEALRVAQQQIKLEMVASMIHRAQRAGI